MIHGKTVAVVVPAYNEETQIGMVIESMPEFVDRIIIVNDKSSDATAQVVQSYQAKETPHATQLQDIRLVPPKKTIYNEAEQVLFEQTVAEQKLYKKQEVIVPDGPQTRIILINHIENGGVGAAIASGYYWCKVHNIDCTAVMAGDGQMDPDELFDICEPVITDKIDYVKGNRLRHPSAKLVIPTIRFVGNSILSILTKIASGYWRISDTQTGYTAISLPALQAIKIYDIYQSYGMPNDLLVKLNINQCTLKEITIKPVYRVGEQSKMKIGKVIRRVSFLLLRLFFKRLFVKYFVRDFHPLFLFYIISFVLGLASLPYAFKIANGFVQSVTISYGPILAFIFLVTAAFQSLVFAMWMDIQDNERLYK